MGSNVRWLKYILDTPKEYNLLMTGKTLTSLERNILIPLAKLLFVQHAFEDKLMEDCYYPDRRSHVAQHIKLADMLRKLINAGKDDEEHDPVLNQADFMDAMERHVDGMDNRLIRFIDAWDDKDGSG